MRAKKGRCIQANGGKLSHTRKLHYAYDFALPTRTPVLAAKDGIVADATDLFTEGGTHPRLRARANYAALRHDDGTYSRYYHLAHRSLSVRVGDAVLAGQRLGLSGNTGFSSTPHLHWDVVNLLPTETARLALDDVSLDCAAASFSGELAAPSAPLQAPLALATPLTADAPIRGDHAGEILLVERCAHVDFVCKAERAQASGAAACIVVNHEDEPPLHTMGAPAAAQPVRLRIPVIMVTRAAGALLYAAASRSATVILSLSPHYRAEHASTDSPFVPQTLRATFYPDGWRPREGSLPPRRVCGALAAARAAEVSPDWNEAGVDVAYARAHTGKECPGSPQRGTLDPCSELAALLKS